MKKQLTKLALTAALALATTLTLSCGNHTFEELLGLDSSSSEQEDNYSSSSFKLSSSSSSEQDDNYSSSSLKLSSSSSSSQQQSGIIVAPLTQTKWIQYSPYNDLFPIVDGERKLTNCGTTAMVQIMKFHKYPARGKGESSVVNPGNVPVPLTNMNVAYDWDNMLNEYTTANPGTEQQRSAVAVLNYHFGLVRGMMGDGLGKVLTDHFGYDKSLQIHSREYYSNAEWEAIIRRQLDLGLPVFYIGNSVANDDPENFSVESGHSFVVDGYDNAGKFHINLGWGASHNRWVSLNDIDAGNGKRYNYGNFIYINIKPDKGGIGSNEMALDSFTVSKTTVSQNEQVTVTAKIKSTGYFTGGQAGVALVNNSGNIVAVIGTRNYDALNPNTYRTPTINCSVPNSVNAGQYNLRIVTKMNGETDWKIVTHSLPNVQKSIPLTVTE